MLSVQVGPTVNPCTKGLWLWNKVAAPSTNDKLLTIYYLRVI